MEGGEAGVELLSAHAFHLWILAIVFFGIGDLVTTYVGLSLGRAVEVGPVAVIASKQFGIAVLLPLKLLTFGLAYLLWRVTPRPYRIGVPLGLAILGIMVTVWNIVILIAIH